MKIAGSFKVSGITKTGTSLILIFSNNQNNDETLPIINKPKHPEKKGGGNARNKMEVSMSKKTKEPSERGEPQWEHQVTEPPLVTRSISNKERGEPFL
jgi:hypothetical protein